MKTKYELAHEHTTSQGDNGNAEISFLAGYSAVESRIAELEEKLKIAMDALEFYSDGAGVHIADEGRYYSSILAAYENDFSENGKLDVRIGTRASETLSKIKGEG